MYYIHAPDANTPLEETLRAIDEVHKSGFFKRFGLSNYHPSDVEQVYNICKSKGYVLPTVYQGNYRYVQVLLSLPFHCQPTSRHEDLFFLVLNNLFDATSCR